MAIGSEASLEGCSLQKATDVTTRLVNDGLSSATPPLEDAGGGGQHGGVVVFGLVVGRLRPYDHHGALGVMGALLAD